MERQKIENEEKLAGWPQVIEVWHFDRSKGCTNIGLRKKTQPCKVDPIFVALKVSDKDCSDALLCDKEDEISKHIPFSQIPQNFCKKDISTGWQKQLRCQACRCLMESTNALKCHLQSTKHTENFTAFVSGKNLNQLASTESKIDNINTSTKSLQTPIHYGSIRKSKVNNSKDVLQSRGTKRRKMETKGEKNKRINDALCSGIFNDRCTVRPVLRPRLSPRKRKQAPSKSLSVCLSVCSSLPASACLSVCLWVWLTLP